MVARRETPDILSDVLGTKPLNASDVKSAKTAKPENHNTGKTEHHNTSTPELRNTVSPAEHRVIDESPVPANEVDADKVKVTFYISSDAVESLETAWLSLRKLAKKGTGRSASKSKIVEAAIRMAAQDVADKGERSQFIGTLVKR